MGGNIRPFCFTFRLEYGIIVLIIIKEFAMALDEIFEKMHSGKIYDPNDEELMEYQETLIERVNQYNQTPATPEGLKKREEMLKEMFAEIGEGSYIEPPFHSNLGGRHVHAGKRFYSNFNLTLVDDTHIFIGDNVLIAPNVTIATACHPTSPTLRREALQYNLPVFIGNNVWIGSGALIMPGTKIGDNSIIGAGSVVTHDIPENVIAAGNPCRILREITEEDEKFYNHGVPIPEEMLEKYK